MMGLKELGARLPPGFRFNPTDEELVCHYLTKKIVSESSAAYDDGGVFTNREMVTSLAEINLHIVEPWQLPEMAKLNATEWYFFSFRDRKYATGFRTNRATASGYWKATGKDRTIYDPLTRSLVGMRKTLVFYKNRAPNGIKTGWIMHEFRLETPHSPPKEDWVLCRVFHKAKISESHQICTNFSSNQQNASTSSCGKQNQIRPFSSIENHNMASNLQNVVINFGAQEDKNPATAASSVTEMASVHDYNFLWDMNLEEINSLAHNIEQGNLQDQWMQIV